MLRLCVELLTFWSFLFCNGQNGLLVMVSVHFDATGLVTSTFNVFTVMLRINDLNQRLNLVSPRSATVAIHCKLPNVTADLVNIQPVFHVLLCLLPA